MQCTIRKDKSISSCHRQYPPWFLAYKATGLNNRVHKSDSQKTAGEPSNTKRDRYYGKRSYRLRYEARRVGSLSSNSVLSNRSDRMLGCGWRWIGGCWVAAPELQEIRCLTCVVGMFARPRFLRARFAAQHVSKVGV